MWYKNTSGFTLVELIVVITILAILGTIAYISFSGYSKDARNSTRLSDIKLIEKTLSFFISIESRYPSPDNATAITYSGGLVSTQGFFSTGVLATVQGLTSIPVDPVLGGLYSYAISNDRDKYQIGGVLEGGLFSYNNPIASQTYALDGSDFSGYVGGDYLSYSVNVPVSTDCRVITMPSLILSEIPAGGILETNTPYKYVHRGSNHLPSQYYSQLDSISGQPGTDLAEILDTCALANIPELDLHIARLSTAYQSLSTFGDFEDVIFNSDTNSFKRNIADSLEQGGISINESITAELNAPPPDQFFIDDFSSADNTQLVGGHVPSSSSGSWLLESGNVGAYGILSSRLTKTDGSSSLIYPSPDPAILNSNMEVSFNLGDFSGGNIYVYLRYTDSDNYYGVELSTTGYRLMRRLGGVDAVGLPDGLEAINSGSPIVFGVSSNTLILNINGIEKERYLIGGINNIGSPVLLLENSGAHVDDYSLRYK